MSDDSRRLACDRDRGLAFSIFDIMILGLGTFGLLYGLTFLPATELFALTADSLSGRAAEGHGYAKSAVLYTPFFALAIAAFAIVARAVRERRGGVR